MPDNLYCEPCRRFLRGEVSVTFQSAQHITFNHHYDFESFDKAMQLPCAICSLAYIYATELPSALNWVKSVGQYFYAGNGYKNTLVFNAAEDLFIQRSARLIFRPVSDVGEQTLSSSTQSDSAIDFFLDKYHNCRATHAQCKLPGRLTSSGYPSRILDVGTEAHDPIVLRNTVISRDEDYVCLSYCWGNIKPFTLNAATHSALNRGIKITTLPKTFRDAISVTRRLHIQYLWIDSLCIFQDNEDDWASESGRMGSIYAHSTCTIAATASDNSDGGLFFERFPLLHQPRPVYFDFSPEFPLLEGNDMQITMVGKHICDVINLAGHCIEYAPLNSRAWVSQERQLSRRILHFTATQIFWECYENLACETYPERLPHWARPFNSEDATVLKQRLHEIREQAHDDTTACLSSPASAHGIDHTTYIRWLTYRGQYSRCALTHSADKLVAIRGIANQICQMTGDEFVAGLWRSRIIEELCWWAHDPRTPPIEWRAPTWSWASSKSEILSSHLAFIHDTHSSRQIEPEVVQVEVKTKASGELENATMDIKCKPLHARFTPATAMESSVEDLDGLLELVDQDDEILECISYGSEVWFKMDHNDMTKTEPQHGYLVVIQRCLHEIEVKKSSIHESAGNKEEEVEARPEPQNPDRDCLEALFLRTRDTACQNYERVGLIFLQGSRAVGQVLKAHRMAEEKVITLI